MALVFAPQHEAVDPKRPLKRRVATSQT